MNRIAFQVVLVVVSVALFFAFSNPLYTNSAGDDPKEWGIQRLKQEIDTYNNAIDTSEQLVAQKASLIAKRDSIDPKNRERLERLLPDTIDNIRLIIDINNIAKPYGLVLKNLQLAGAEKNGAKGDSAGVAIGGNDTIGSVTMQFSVTARYPVFKQFLRDLQNSLRLVDVTDVKITGGTKDFYDYSVTLKTYWLH